jgi:hypothetical protein
VGRPDKLLINSSHRTMRASMQVVEERRYGATFANKASDAPDLKEGPTSVFAWTPSILLWLPLVERPV